MKNIEANMSGPVGPAVGKTCGPDSKKVGLGPAGPLLNQGCIIVASKR